jgi:small subunit ribosomal protein S20
MANHKSAAKRARQSVKRKTVNNKRKGIVKTIEKKLLQAISLKDSPKAQELLKTFASYVDRAAKNSVVSKNHASRKKSRLSASVAHLAK